MTDKTTAGATDTIKIAAWELLAKYFKDQPDAWWPHVQKALPEMILALKLSAAKARGEAPTPIDHERESYARLDREFVLVPRDLLGAACSAIEKKRDAPEILKQLRAITFASNIAEGDA